MRGFNSFRRYLLGYTTICVIFGSVLAQLIAHFVIPILIYGKTITNLWLFSLIVGGTLLFLVYVGYSIYIAFKKMVDCMPDDPNCMPSKAAENFLNHIRKTNTIERDA